MVKKRLKEQLWEQDAVEVQPYYDDNRILKVVMFHKYCGKMSQYKSCSGSGAQHQNARSEHATQSVIYMAQNFMVNTLFHWDNCRVDDKYLWYFFIKHSAYIYNQGLHR